MIKNYIKIALRNIINKKSYSFISIFSLVTGLTVFFLIALFVYNETSYDSFHKNSEDIYRISFERKYPTTVSDWATLPPGVGPSLKESLPEVKAMTRINKHSGSINYNAQIFFEENILFVDSTFNDVFDLQIIEGNKKPLMNPLTAVISKSNAQKYFGNESPINKNIVILDSINITISAVAEDMPNNSHFQYDILVSSFPIWTVQQPFTTWVVGFGFNTYLRFNNSINIKEVNQKIENETEKKMIGEIWGEEAAYRDWVNSGNLYKFYLTPLQDIHLHSNKRNELSINGDIHSIFLFSAIGILVLFIASANFMNIMTARSAGRAKEVGIRKVLGSNKNKLIVQFITEAVLLTLLSAATALIILELVLPLFNTEFNKDFILSDYLTLTNVMFILIFTIFLGIISGSYPAFYLSRFNPVRIFRGNVSAGMKSSKLRNSLVIVQFAFTILLLTETLTINEQMNFLSNKNLGYNNNNVLVIENLDLIGENVITLRNELSKNSGIKSISLSDGTPSGVSLSTTLTANTNDENSRFNTKRILGDHNYLNTYGIELIAGRKLSELDELETVGYGIVNEELLKTVGLTGDAIGKNLYFLNGAEIRIVGVMKNFHFESLHEKIAPLIFFPMQPNYNNKKMSLALSGENMYSTIQFVEDTFKKINPNHTIKYSFLDERISKLYENEKTTLKLFTSFSFLAIIIACVGLLGLTAFASEQRTREIGIRKVLGASVSKIIILLSRDFLIPIIIANLIGVVIAYNFISAWLERFVYRIDLGADIFIISFLLTIIISFSTIVYQSYKAATTNPIKALKHQ